MKDKLLTIREAAALLGVSIDTLRRWDKSGKLTAIRKGGGTHRYYTQRDLELFSSDLFKLANEWAFSAPELPAEFYCQNSAILQTRLTKMQDSLTDSGVDIKLVSLLVAVAGEIGNNSFDHNLGNWPDVSGVFYGYDLNKKEIILADRGVGILKTLHRVKPTLSNSHEALYVAFTEIITGRAPEKRGNGLKFVRSVVANSPINLFFQSGDAELRIQEDNDHLHITRSQIFIRGCLAQINY